MGPPGRARRSLFRPPELPLVLLTRRPQDLLDQCRRGTESSTPEPIDLGPERGNLAPQLGGEEETQSANQPQTEAISQPAAYLIELGRRQERRGAGARGRLAPQGGRSTHATGRPLFGFFYCGNNMAISIL